MARCQNWPPEPLGGGDIGGQILNFGPDFPKMGSPPPPNFTFFESPREALQALKILWAKVQKQAI